MCQIFLFEETYFFMKKITKDQVADNIVLSMLIWSLNEFAIRKFGSCGCHELSNDLCDYCLFEDKIDGIPGRIPSDIIERYKERWKKIYSWSRDIANEFVEEEFKKEMKRIKFLEDAAIEMDKKFEEEKEKRIQRELKLIELWLNVVWEDLTREEKLEAILNGEKDILMSFIWFSDIIDREKWAFRDFRTVAEERVENARLWAKKSINRRMW